METANQAKARGSNSVSVMYCNEPQFFISSECLLILCPLASGGCKHHVSTLLDYAFPCLHVQNYMVIILERGTRFCFNVHRDSGIQWFFVLLSLLRWETSFCLWPNSGILDVISSYIPYATQGLNHCLFN